MHNFVEQVGSFTPLERVEVPGFHMLICKYLECQVRKKRSMDPKVALLGRRSTEGDSLCNQYFDPNQRETARQPRVPEGKLPGIKNQMIKSASGEREMRLIGSLLYTPWMLARHCWRTPAIRDHCWWLSLCTAQVSKGKEEQRTYSNMSKVSTTPEPRPLLHLTYTVLWSLLETACDYDAWDRETLMHVTDSELVKGQKEYEEAVMYPLAVITLCCCFHRRIRAKGAS